MTKLAILAVIKALDKAGVDDILKSLAGKIGKKMIRKYLDDLVDEGAVEKVEPVKTGGPGRPAYRFKITDIGVELVEKG